MYDANLLSHQDLRVRPASDSKLMHGVKAFWVSAVLTCFTLIPWKRLKQAPCQMNILLHLLCDATSKPS